MQTDQPASIYHDGYLDALYQPYTKSPIPVHYPGGFSGHGTTCSYERNPEKTKLPPYVYTPMINPELIRKGWHKRYQPMRSEYPCADGFVKMGDGLCYPAFPSFEPQFYKDETGPGDVPLMSSTLTKVPTWSLPKFKTTTKAYLGRRGSEKFHGPGDYAAHRVPVTHSSLFKTGFGDNNHRYYGY